jgi:hypothetical protein
MELRQIVNAPIENASPATADSTFSDRIASPAPISQGDFSQRISSPNPISAADDFSLRTSDQAAKLSLSSLPSRTASQPLKLPPKSTVQSPCLYIGPAGERCSRTAGPSGFCAKHQLTAPSESTSKAVNVKRAAAVLGVLAALWPFIADLIREIIRLLR